MERSNCLNIQNNIMPRFSERYGYVKPVDVLKRGGLDDEAVCMGGLHGCGERGGDGH